MERNSIRSKHAKTNGFLHNFQVDEMIPTINNFIDDGSKRGPCEPESSKTKPPSSMVENSINGNSAQSMLEEEGGCIDCAEGHDELSDVYYQSDHSGTRCVIDSGPCRHTQALHSLIRSNEDCKSCMRHIGGTFVSPRYPQIRQRLLKTLNQRKDNMEDNLGEQLCQIQNTNNPDVKYIPCGKKERLLLVNRSVDHEDVDDIVKMIEGVKPCSNDPKKAAKKARQKEKKLQVKLEEERRREEEERRKREEEERLLREQQEREEEERRKAEEQKRLARKQKKKNRKLRKDAEKEKEKMDNGDNSYEPSQEKSLVGGSTQPVTKAIEAVPEFPDEGKPRMVTIRRLPCAENQNVVTITLTDDNEGKHPVYMLVNGQLYMGDPANLNADVENPGGISAQSTAEDKKKKKKKKKGATSGPEEQIPSPAPAQDSLSRGPSNVILKDISTASSSFKKSQPVGESESVDLRNLNLPPGITITKVPSLAATAPRPDPSPSINISVLNERDVSNRVLTDDNFLYPSEDEEFEEVVSKNRKKKIRAAKIDNDEADSRSSPNSIKSQSRRHSLASDKSDSGQKWVPAAKSKTQKFRQSGQKSSSSEKFSKRDQTHFPVPPESFLNGSYNNLSNLIPRLNKHIKPDDSSKWRGSSSKKSNGVTIERLSPSVQCPSPSVSIRGFQPPNHHSEPPVSLSQPNPLKQDRGIWPSCANESPVLGPFMAQANGSNMSQPYNIWGGSSLNSSAFQGFPPNGPFEQSSGADMKLSMDPPSKSPIQRPSFSLSASSPFSSSSNNSSQEANIRGFRSHAPSSSFSMEWNQNVALGSSGPAPSEFSTLPAGSSGRGEESAVPFGLTSGPSLGVKKGGFSGTGLSRSSVPQSPFSMSGVEAQMLGNSKRFSAGSQFGAEVIPPSPSHGNWTSFKGSPPCAFSQDRVSSPQWGEAQPPLMHGFKHQPTPAQDAYGNLRALRSRISPLPMSMEQKEAFDQLITMNTILDPSSGSTPTPSGGRSQETLVASRSLTDGLCEQVKSQLSVTPRDNVLLNNSRYPDFDGRWNPTKSTFG